MSRAAWRERNPLRIWRVERRMSQGDVALHLGVSRQSVANWEEGVCDPTLHWANLELMMKVKHIPQKWRRWRAAR